MWERVDGGAVNYVCWWCSSRPCVRGFRCAPNSPNSIASPILFWFWAILAFVDSGEVCAVGDTMLVVTGWGWVHRSVFGVGVSLGVFKNFAARQKVQTPLLHLSPRASPSLLTPLSPAYLACLHSNKRRRRNRSHSYSLLPHSPSLLGWFSLLITLAVSCASVAVCLRDSKR